MARRPVLPRLLVLAAAAASVSQLGSWGPALATKTKAKPKGGDVLKDRVEGDLDVILSRPRPEFALRGSALHRSGVGLEAHGGRLSATYATKIDPDTALQLAVDDEQAWQAAVEGHSRALRLRGRGPSLEDLYWEASQEGAVDGLGDVKVQFSSNDQYNLTVDQDDLLQLAGLRLGAGGRASNEGLAVRLAARRPLPGGTEVAYSVENPLGVYDVASLRHRGELRGPLAGGLAVLGAEGDATSQAIRGSFERPVAGGDLKVLAMHRDGDTSYDASYDRRVSGLPVDARARLGVDDKAAYGQLSASRPLGRGLGAEYEANARIELQGKRDKAFSQTFKLKHELGDVQLVQSNADQPRVRVHYAFGS